MKINKRAPLRKPKRVKAGPPMFNAMKVIAPPTTTPAIIIAFDVTSQAAKVIETAVRGRNVVKGAVSTIWPVMRVYLIGMALLVGIIVVTYVLYKYVCCPKQEKSKSKTKGALKDAKKQQEMVNDMIEVKRKEEERAMKEALDKQERLEKELLLEEVKAQKIEDVGLEVRKVANKRKMERKKAKQDLELRILKLEKLAKDLEEERKLRRKVEAATKRSKKRKQAKRKKEKFKDFYD